MTSCNEELQNKIQGTSDNKEVHLVDDTGQIVPKHEYQDIENLTNTNEQENIIYTSDDEFAFSLVFPKSWEGKYFIEKNKYGIGVYYNTEIGRSKKILFFEIGKMKKSEWVRIAGAPMPKIYEDDEFTYYVTVPEKMRFDLNLENERREADEFRNLFKDISIIIDSFKLISSTSP